VPTFRLENEQGQWLTNIRFSTASWKPGDRISRGRDALEVVAVRETPDGVTLVVSEGRVQKSDNLRSSSSAGRVRSRAGRVPALEESVPSRARCVELVEGSYSASLRRGLGPPAPGSTAACAAPIGAGGPGADSRLRVVLGREVGTTEHVQRPTVRRGRRRP